MNVIYVKYKDKKWGALKCPIPNMLHSSENITIFSAWTSSGALLICCWGRRTLVLWFGLSYSLETSDDAMQKKNISKSSFICAHLVHRHVIDLFFVHVVFIRMNIKYFLHMSRNIILLLYCRIWILSRLQNLFVLLLKLWKSVEKACTPVLDQ